MPDAFDVDPTRSPRHFAAQSGAAFGLGRTVRPNTMHSVAGELAAGSLIKGRFEIGEELGRGGMGVVYRARDLRKVEAHDPDPFVAIKILSPDLAGFDRSFIALQREAKHAQALSHPNIVKVFDFDRDEERVFLTMELLQGESLQQRLRDFSIRPLSSVDRLRLANGILEGMSYAHAQGIVHADVKPSNVFVCTNGEPKILDFGIARRREYDTVFDADDLGALSVDYASVEMLANMRPTPADDVFAIGCLLFGLYDGRHPFDHQRADEAMALRKEVVLPSGLSRMQGRAVRKALRFQRAERFEDARKLADAFTAHDWFRTIFLAMGLGAVLATFAWLLNDAVRSAWSQAWMNAGDRESLATALEDGRKSLEMEYWEDATMQFVKALRLDAHNATARDGLESVEAILRHTMSREEYLIGFATLRERAQCSPGDASCPKWVQTFFDRNIALPPRD